MFDTMTLTKIVGGFCGALLIFLLGSWASELIIMGGEGHLEHAEQAFVVELPDANAPAEEAAPEVPFEELFAAADAAAGEGEFRACKSCHSVEPGENGTGPTLYGVVGRAVDSVPDYSYSGALEEVVDVWTPENIFHFIEHPQQFAPGTKMTFNGLADPEDRVNLIAWLDSLDN